MTAALTAKQLRFVAALLTGASIVDAAEAAGISKRTAERWHVDPEVRSEIAAASRSILREAEALLRSHASEAVNVAVGIMRSGTGEGIRLRAALALIDGARAVDLADLEERVFLLEREHTEANS